MHAENLWDHDAYFDYVDRWMMEDDTELMGEMVRQLGENYQHIPLIRNYPQKKTIDIFVDNMWSKYRNNLPAKH
jgi:hypothetical protein